jgi:protein SCO1
VTPRWACPFVAAVLAVLVVAPGQARAQSWIESNQVAPNTTPAELTGVDIVEHLGGALPRDAIFRDADGKPTTLGGYFDFKRPTLLVFAYHTCPMLCSLVLDAAVRSLNGMAWTVGREFDVVSVSIDPKDTPETATRKRAQVVGSYARANGSVAGWHFLVGDEENIRKVTNAVGFQYNYDARQKQYAHPAAIYLLSPEGRIARYLYGIEYPTSDVRLGLLDASEGRSISTTERILLYCYHYDPQGKRYSLVAMNVMRLGGVVTLIAIGSFLVGMWARERSRRARPATAPAAGDPRKAAAGPDLRVLRSALGTEAARAAPLRQTGGLDGPPPSTWPRQGP